MFRYIIDIINTLTMLIDGLLFISEDKDNKLFAQCFLMLIFRNKIKFINKEYFDFGKYRIHYVYDHLNLEFYKNNEYMGGCWFNSNYIPKNGLKRKIGLKLYELLEEKKKIKFNIHYRRKEILKNFI